MKYSRSIAALKIFGLVAVFFLPYALVMFKNKNTIKIHDNPLALAGRKVYENSGCQGCHTRYVRKNLEDIIRYDPDEYYRFNTKNTNTLTEKVDITGLRIGPDLEYLPYHAIDQDHLTRYLADARALNKNSIMPSYERLFKEKLRDDEIIFASGSLKNKQGYGIYSRGDALVYYLKVSTMNFYGRSQ